MLRTHTVAPLGSHTVLSRPPALAVCPQQLPLQCLLVDRGCDLRRGSSESHTEVRASIWGVRDRCVRACTPVLRLPSRGRGAPRGPGGTAHVAAV